MNQTKSAHIVIDAGTSGTSTGRYPEKLVQNLTQIDSQNRYTILVWSRFMDKAPGLPKNFTYKVADYPVNGSFNEQVGLLKDLEDLQPDLVHFTLPQRPFFYRGKKVTTVHDLTGVRFRNPEINKLIFIAKVRVYSRLVKHAVKKSLEIIVPSQFVKDDLIKFTGVSGDKITVTYEAADAITEAATPIEHLTGQRFLMYVGRPTPHKNLQRLIDAFVLLQEKQPDLWLVLAGKKDANYQRIEAGVQARKLQNIYFTDFVSEGQLRWLYENCAAYVFPSLSEGFGLPGLEAMAHGAPVVSSNATCLPEIYGEAAQYFDPTDVAAMAQAIEEVLGDAGLRAALIAKGLAQVKQYSWRRMAEQTLEVYRKALN